MQMYEPHTPIILTVAEAAWMLIGLIVVLGIAYYVGWYIGALNYAETMILGG
jgi:hypothetical protein